MLISAGVAAYVADWDTLAAVLLGVAVSSKQSMFWLFPLVGVVLRFDLKRWVVLGASALLPLVPFMLWDFKALKHANFDFMSGLPPRRDALCFTNAVWKMSGVTLPALGAFLLSAGVVGLAVSGARPALPGPREADEGQPPGGGFSARLRSDLLRLFLLQPLGVRELLLPPDGPGRPRRRRRVAPRAGLPDEGRIGDGAGGRAFLFCA